MPRKRINTRTAEKKPGAAPPTRKAGDRTSPEEMMTRRRIMRELMLVATTPEKCLAAMQTKFADITMAEVKRLYEEAEAELIERATEKLSTKKARQEARVLNQIAGAQGKGQYGHCASLERVYADIAGTNAPIQVRHTVTYNHRFEEAMKLHASRLSLRQAQGLLQGSTVPLGLAGAGDVVTTGEESK